MVGCILKGGINELKSLYKVQNGKISFKSGRRVSKEQFYIIDKGNSEEIRSDSLCDVLIVKQQGRMIFAGRCYTR
jgi:hypothetical protein